MSLKKSLYESAVVPAVLRGAETSVPRGAVEEKSNMP